MKKLKVFLLLISSLLLFYQCEKEIEMLDENSNKSFFNSLSFSKINDIKNKKIIKQNLKHLLDNELNRTSSNHYSIDTTNVQILSSDYYTNYTFVVNREIENENYLDNYVLTVFNDSIYHQMFISYPIIR